MLRPAATAVGPVLTELTEELGFSATTAGALTALPGFVFALIGLTANRLITLMRPASALAFASGLVLIGSLLRAITGSWILFLFLTLVALGGMAIGNVLVPAFIKIAFPSRSALMATAYTTFLAVGATLPNLIVDPLVRFGGWRLSLGVWSAVAAVAMLLWIAVSRTFGEPAAPLLSGKSLSLRALMRSRIAVALMLFFGFQSMQAYIQFGWLAEVYRSGGMSPGTAALMLAIISAGGIPGGILMPRIVAHQRWLRPCIIVFAVLLAVGYAGLALIPTTAPWLWAISLSVAGFCFPTALALVIERTENPQVTSAVSGFVQPVGYLLSATGPLLVGVAFGFTGSWTPIMWALAACAIPLGISGWIAATPRCIDEELS